ncbi:MAG: glycosyltransferase family 4 protein [Prevotella sp.]|nr:glycosyltransferase family 4 protein [Prevotella sp.]
MKILIPFSYYHPEQCAGLFVIDDMTEVAAREGIESLITVPSPTRNVPADAKWESNETLWDGKVKVHRFHMYGEGKNPVLRAFRYLLCEIVQLHYMLWKDYDVAFIDSTPPIQGLKLPIVRLFRKKPFVYNAQDLFPETLSGTGLANQGGILWKIGMWVSNVTFRNSDEIIAISNDIKRSMVARGVPAEKIEVVYNWVDEKAVHPVAKKDNPLFEEFGLSRDKFTIVYAGNLGNAQNIGIVLDGAKELPDVQFAVFGSGGLENEVRKRISDEGLTNIHLNPLQPVERVKYVYSLGDACIVSCKEGLGGSAMPSKSWSIMSCGRPVVASFDEGELKEILENNNCGVFSHAGNVKEFMAAIRQMATNREQCEEMGKNARQFILDNLTKEMGAKKYVNIIKSVVKK